MHKLTIPLALFLLNCASPAGDEQSLAWVGEPQECAVHHEVECRDGEIRITKSCSVLRDCSMVGSVRVMGPARNGNRLKEESREDWYIEWIRAAAPANVLIENVSIEGTGTVPLYIAPGVTFTTIRNVELTGKSKGPGLYLDAESHGTVIRETVVDVSTYREQVAVDASDANDIEVDARSVNLYRNCGEDGVIRHTTPSFNRIVSTGKIRENSRQGLRTYCGADAGYEWGSSLSNLDHGRGNKLFPRAEL